ncbi:MAG: hypothetical protein IJX51_01895 [Clostridia bacterium]|nr:hypothetical protein [Clostridia bacterium]
MKKIFALLLVVLMLVPFVVACDNNDDDNTTTTTTNNGGNNTSSSIDSDAPWSSKTDVKTTWSGKTLNIACSTWSGSPGAPWSVMELCIDYGKDSGFGTGIDKAVLERQEFIKETYGVDLKWINATRWSMHDALEQATLAENVNYDLAMPRMMRAQQIVAGGYVYDMGGREYIDFDNTYYNDLSIKNYTSNGHTFFMTGDFSNLDKETAFVLYFNKEILGGEKPTADLYQAVREGKWTWDMLITLANGAYSDDGDGVHGDTDTYGLSIASVNRFYEFFGVTQAGVDESTGKWEITLDDPKVDKIVAAIISANTADWARSAWSGSWGSAAGTALKDGRLLFYNEVIQHSYVGTYGNMGIVPFPMLDEAQGRYYAPCAYQQTVLMCIPKITQDRAMSDYFVDVLAWTGRDYTMKAYIQGKADQFDSPVEIEMIQEYIFPNVLYDAGGAVGWGDLIGSVKGASHNGNKNNFAQAFAEAQPGALETIASWNEAWGGYTE